MDVRRREAYLCFAVTSRAVLVARRAVAVAVPGRRTRGARGGHGVVAHVAEHRWLCGRGLRRERSEERNRTRGHANHQLLRHAARERVHRRRAPQRAAPEHPELLHGPLVHGLTLTSCGHEIFIILLYYIYTWCTWNTTPYLQISHVFVHCTSHCQYWHAICIKSRKFSYM